MLGSPLRVGCNILSLKLECWVHNLHWKFPQGFNPFQDTREISPRGKMKVKLYHNWVLGHDKDDVQHEYSHTTRAAYALVPLTIQK